MRGLLIYGVAWLVLVVAVCVRYSEARGSKDGSRGKNSKGKNKAAESGDCIIDQDKDGLYFVLCGDAARRNKERNNNNNKKKCKCERGKRGPRGHRGPRGSRGKPGKQGPPGPVGADGRDGRPGLTGPKGPAGVPGQPGLSGLQGLKGNHGAHGLPGPKGQPGLPGLIGPPGNCIKKSVVGKVVSPMFHCLKGKTGVQGPKGSRGIAGPEGPMGLRGNKGQKGEKGDVGQRGRIGRPGPPGDFNNFSCSPRYTSWINVNQWESSQPDVYCDTKEFLQGFRLEKANFRKRYRYICCKLTKKG